MMYVCSSYTLEYTRSTYKTGENKYYKYIIYSKNFNGPYLQLHIRKKLIYICIKFMYNLDLSKKLEKLKRSCY